jgi:ferredoxin-NADP reductase
MVGCFTRATTDREQVAEGKMLAKSIPSLRGPIYYIAGPPAMVAAMRQMLVTTGVDEDDIRAEEFLGYRIKISKGFVR